MEPAFHIGEITSIEDKNTVSYLDNFTIFQNYPNPFNSSTNFLFNINGGEIKNIEITIYDILGRELKRINHGHLITGINKVSWNGTDKFGNPVSSGLYIAKLKGGDKALVKKLLIIR
ncbi:MAG: T9SS type A sorting domain-containing protein, partial [Calditrichales bacterium]|nr:T9SS type A sorting domain-containing protein [Calditrichales bacterium]